MSIAREPLKFFVKPAPGMRVKDPATLRVLALEGEEKPQTTYWLRRVVDGDVIILDQKSELSEQKLETQQEMVEEVKTRTKSKKEI